MPKITGQVSRYTVVAESEAGGKVVHRLRLELAAPPGAVLPDFDVVFVDSPPQDFIVFGAEIVSVSLEASAFDSMYEIVRTEQPVFAAAVEVQLLGRTLRRFSLSTDPEPVGEGDADTSASAPASAPPVVPSPPDPAPFR